MRGFCCRYYFSHRRPYLASHVLAINPAHQLVQQAVVKVVHQSARLGDDRVPMRVAPQLNELMQSRILINAFIKFYHLPSIDIAHDVQPMINHAVRRRNHDGFHIAAAAVSAPENMIEHSEF